ncbi:Jag N-terminal domain-containing protein [Helicobacter himalayensis]|uniref:Jag N-terminal domain-containing protein n=1 Tax=Helicobacter himalayensis TaxID=1591088 RepID=UPI000836AB49|nr:Jag N-terminal domain-containing protein [Helicobacter himalayensis]
MKKIAARTIQEALLKASEEFRCSVVDLEYEVAQNPSAGFLGIGRKDAIIIVDSKKDIVDFKQDNKKPQNLHTNIESKPFERQAKKEFSHKDFAKQEPQESFEANGVSCQDFDSNQDSNDEWIWGSKSLEFTSFNKESKRTYKSVPYTTEYSTTESNPKTPKPYSSKPHTQSFNPQAKEQILKEIESDLRELLACLPFDLDFLEVKLLENNLLFIKIDGADCALLIGEKGYRYKALLYLLFNWINPKYDFTIRLEVAEFLANQEQMMNSYLQGVIKMVNENAKAQTKPLDGILAYIALSKLRETFPQKYVSFRLNENGEKYIIINDFRRF